MIFILYHNSGVHSGRALARTLRRNLSGTAVQGGFPRFYRRRLRRARPSLLVNLGTTLDLDPRIPVLNCPDMVRTSSNKRSARRTFRDAGVPIPKLFLAPEKIREADLPIVGRTSYHSKGRGFWYCQRPVDVQRAARRGATHFLEFVSGAREYRVHTFAKTAALSEPREQREPEDYVSIKVSEKVWRGAGKENPLNPQRNHSFGWTFLGPQNRREEEIDVVRSAAKAAIAALGMDFGAVDVMYSIRQKLPYVLEVNSTPSLADEQADTCERYATRIARIAEEMKSGSEESDA